MDAHLQALYYEFGKENVEFMSVYKNMDKDNLRCMPITGKWIIKYRVVRFQRIS